MSAEKKAETSSMDVYRRVRFPGICAFARNYGYNYTSVYKHLTGERPSRKMAARWQSWNGKKGVAV